MTLEASSVMQSDAHQRVSSPLTFDRLTGRVGGAGVRERLAIEAMQAGARISSAWYYRGFAVGCGALRAVSAEQMLEVQLNADARFSFPFCDGYWSLLLDRRYSYERDIELFFRGIAQIDYALIDCGANFGYWSTLVSSRPYGSHKSIAIEPSSSNYAVLSRNAAINNERFSLLKSAIGATDGIAHLSGRKHEAMTIADSSPDGEAVPVMTLDTLMDRFSLPSDGRYVVKLDVEGVEVPAMQGGKRLLQTDCVVICEEHGNDRNHTISRYILDNTPLKLFCYDPASRKFEHLSNVSALDRIKKAVNVGYNILATVSPYWEQHIRSLSAASPSM